MKKLATLLLALALMLTAVTAYAASPAEVVGTWYVTSMTRTYGEYGAGVPLSDYHLDLNRDSTATLVFNGVERPYTWQATEEGVKLSPLSDTEEEYENYWYLDLALTEEGVLTLNTWDFGGIDTYYDFVFGREPVDTTLPNTVAAEKEDDFFGEWYAIGLVQDGMLYDITAGGAKIAIEFAQITFSGADGESTVVLSDYQDGAVTCDSSAIERGSTAKLELTDMDGVICATISKEGAEPYCVYLTNSIPADTVDVQVETEEAEVETGAEAAEEAVEEAPVEEAEETAEETPAETEGNK